MSMEFLITTLIIVATPGPGAIFSLTAGLSRGAKASVIAAFGATLGIVPHILAAITGLAALLHASALAFQTIKYLGVLYLLYMAWATWREHGSLDVKTETSPQSPLRVIASGIFINFLNPKLTIFFVAFLPQFVDTNASGATSRMIELSAIFMLATFVIFAIYGIFAAAMRSRIISKPHVMTWLRRSFAGSFVALSARLAFTQR